MNSFFGIIFFYMERVRNGRF